MTQKYLDFFGDREDVALKRKNVHYLRPSCFQFQRSKRLYELLHDSSERAHA